MEGIANLRFLLLAEERDEEAPANGRVHGGRVGAARTAILLTFPCLDTPLEETESRNIPRPSRIASLPAKEGEETGRGCPL